MFQDQLQRGFIEEIPHSELEGSGFRVHYIPHHLVEKSSSTTTKARVVMNAASKEIGQTSLNDMLEAGPNTEADLLALLIRFRLQPIGLTADVERAFLQINSDHPDHDVTKFLWIKDGAVGGPLAHYRHLRVPFGLTSSPFLLGATFLHHLSKYQSSQPAVQALCNDPYVDDLVTGAQNDDETIALAEEATRISEKLDSISQHIQRRF